MGWMRKVSIGAALCLAAVSLTAAGCGAALTAPSVIAPYSQTDLVAGTGAVAANGNALGVNYVGWLYDSTQPGNKGAQFDASTPQTRALAKPNNPDPPFGFALGTGSVIKGWDQGIVGMQAGGIRRLVIPPSLAYGNTRKGAIPQNSTLIFEVELVTVAN